MIDTRGEAKRKEAEEERKESRTCLKCNSATFLDQNYVCTRCYNEVSVNDLASDHEAPVIQGARMQRQQRVISGDLSDDSNAQPKDGKRKSKAQRKTAQLGKKERKA